MAVVPAADEATPGEPGVRKVRLAWGWRRTRVIGWVRFYWRVTTVSSFFMQLSTSSWVIRA